MAPQGTGLPEAKTVEVAGDTAGRQTHQRGRVAQSEVVVNSSTLPTTRRPRLS